MWAGVQNVSRPIDRCHEMSQRSPTTMLVAPSAAAITGPATGEPASSSVGMTRSRSALTDRLMRRLSQERLVQKDAGDRESDHDHGGARPILTEAPGEPRARIAADDRPRDHDHRRVPVD